MHLAMYQMKHGVPIWHQTRCFSFSIHPSWNSFRENKTQQHERAEKEDNKDVENVHLIMFQILSLFHISSLSFPSKGNNWHILILKVD